MGALAKKKLPAEGCLEGVVNEKNVRGKRRYQMIDTKRKAEKRVEWRMLSLQ